jgi:DNA-binding transcriptional LysR family regulator
MLPFMTAKMQEKLDWSDIQVLASFAATNDVTAAARHLRMDETTVSRRIRRLSAALNLALVEVRERKLILTEAGRMLAQAAQPMAEAALGLSRIVERQALGPKGLVRITAIRAIFGRIILPGIARFRESFPDIELELIGDTRNLSLTQREADVAIRLALPTGNHLITRHLADIGFAVYAPAGIDPASAPWLGYNEAFGHLPEAQWLEAQRAGQPIILRANGIEMLVKAMQLGLGKTVLPCFVGDCEPGLMRLTPAPVLKREVWIAVHEEDRRTARIRAVMDLVIERFETMRPELEGDTRLG